MDDNTKNHKDCYRCNAIATSREHVPPICLFPEAKDVSQLNFRKDLITVPSCDLHNSKKSHDDEFLMVSIAGIVSNNKLGYIHSRTKIDRALRRKSADFLRKTIIRNAKEKILVFSNGTKVPVLLGRPDVERLKICFEHIAYGIWCHEFGNTFRGEIQMLFGFLAYENNNDQMLINFIRKRFELDDRLLEEKGSNPDVFTYQFCQPDEFGAIALKLVFYKGTEVFVSMLPEGGSKPYNLGMDLMNRGLHTTFTLGDDKFEFNKPPS